MTRLFLRSVLPALAVSSMVAVATPAFALILQKTIVLQKAGEKAVTQDTGVTPSILLACDVGVGNCVYETITSIQMGGNVIGGNTVGLYLSIDGSAPPCLLSGGLPSDGSFYERTTVLENQGIARGAHNVQLRMCSSSGGFHTESYTATIRVYTAK
jgi:hypothetical protein